MDEALFQKVEAGAVVVTATRRLAREIVRAYDGWQRALGRTAWPAARCLPLAAWLREEWSATWPDVALPSEPQSLALWEGVITGDLAGRDDSTLIDIAALARLAAEASRLSAAYRLPAEGWSDEERAFLRWRDRFRRRCADLAWLDPATLPDAVAAALAEGRHTSPAAMVVAGFDRLTPAEDHLVTVLGRAGTGLTRWLGAGEPARVVRRAPADPESEVLEAARWARGQWRPGRRLAVVVPDLEARRALIERIFTAELAPSAVLPGAEEQRAFDLSLGPPLTRHPVVAAALALLAAAIGRIPFDRATALLGEPFVGAEEGEARARAELHLRRRRATERTLREVAAAAHDAGAKATAAHLAAFEEALRGSAARLPSDWAHLFSEALGDAGWPGPRPLTSAEMQAVAAWNGQLAALAALDTVAGSLSLAAAVARLHALCGRPFQPEGGEAPVQVMGLLEAAGLRFDAAWIMGLDAATLPAAPRCHPLLPAALQRRLDLPHATAHGELAFARRLFDRLRALAPEVVVSAPCQVGEEQRFPSPLILPFPVAELPLAPSVAIAAATLGSGRLEAVAERPARPLPPATAVRGGAQVIEHQSLCPFRAFATHGLAARRLEPVEEEPSSRTRGILVHDALEWLWQAIGDHAALVTLGEDARAALCEQAAQSVVASSALVTGRRAVVAAHLARLLVEWLGVEAGRSPFTVVAHEQQIPVVVGDLHLDLRIDRIDRLADGATLVIDYKTGEVRTADWWDDRPAAPQLPLYAAVAAEEVAAVAFAKVVPGACKLSGVGAADVGSGVIEVAKAKGCPAATWPELVDRWREIAERLAGAFAAREAAVDPLRKGDDLVGCSYCDLAPLCRIHEQGG